MLLFKVEL